MESKKKNPEVVQKRETNEVPENMKLYELFRKVPEGAIKKIEEGKLKNFSNINPMWRIKMLTEAFGPCGIGWFTKEVERWKEEYTLPVKIGNGYQEQLQVATYVKIHLFFKTKSGQWSDAVEGIGGSKEVGKGVGEGISDECYKMAYTDAISVACKSLGIGADVYFANDITKYGGVGEQQKEIEELEKKNELDKIEFEGKISAAKSINELNDVWKAVVARFGKGTEFYEDLWKTAGEKGRELKSGSVRRVKTQLPEKSLEEMNIEKTL